MATMRAFKEESGRSPENEKRIFDVYYAERTAACGVENVGACLFFGNSQKKKDFCGRMLYI